MPVKMQEEESKSAIFNRFPALVWLLLSLRNLYKSISPTGIGEQGLVPAWYPAL